MTLNVIYRVVLDETKHRVYLHTEISASFIVSCVNYAYVAPRIICDTHALFPLLDCIQNMSANLCGGVASQAGPSKQSKLADETQGEMKTVGRLRKKEWRGTLTQEYEVGGR